jgi:hypothetical protein
MTPLALSLLLSLSPPAAHAPQPTTPENTVRVCSVASGTCQDFASRGLEPAAPAAAARSAQRIFLDPATKAVVQPTQADLDELAVSVDEEMAKSRETSVEKMANGTLKLKSPTGFAVDQKAVIHPAPPAHPAKAAKPEVKP